MILWHLGMGAALVYVSLGRHRIDYRYILAGAITPDVVDGVLGIFFFDGPAGRWVAHSILAVVVVALGVLVGSRGERRLARFGLAVGWLTHLVCDGMWQAPQTFLWPAFGGTFSASPVEPYSWTLFTEPLEHLSTWGGELVGFALLAWFWVAFRLGESGRRAAFLKDGLLRA